MEENIQYNRKPRYIVKVAFLTIMMFLIKSIILFLDMLILSKKILTVILKTFTKDLKLKTLPVLTSIKTGQVLSFVER